jgi:hypothetical protein
VIPGAVGAEGFMENFLKVFLQETVPEINFKLFGGCVVVVCGVFVVVRFITFLETRCNLSRCLAKKTST